MAVLPAVLSKAPAKPVDLEVKAQPDKSLHTRWQADGAHGRFQVEVCYFEFEGPMLDPFHSSGIIQVERCAAFVPHPEQGATGPSLGCEGLREGSVRRRAVE